MISRQRHHQRNSDRKKWRRSKRGRGSSKTCVSPASNSNSFPHSNTGQPTRNFSLLEPSAVGCVRTTQVPHLGQVTHEHAMRSAIYRNYFAPSNERAFARSSGGTMQKVYSAISLGVGLASRGSESLNTGRETCPRAPQAHQVTNQLRMWSSCLEQGLTGSLAFLC